MPGPVVGVLSLTVGAGVAGLVTDPALSRTVGAGAGGFAVPGPDVFNGMVGAGAGVGVLLQVLLGLCYLQVSPLR